MPACSDLLLVTASYGAQATFTDSYNKADMYHRLMDIPFHYPFNDLPDAVQTQINSIGTIRKIGSARDGPSVPVSTASIPGLEALSLSWPLEPR